MVVFITKAISFLRQVFVNLFWAGLWGATQAGLIYLD